MSASGPETSREVLSAFADGECSEFECRLAVQRLVESEAERRRLERYQLIGAVLREEHLVRVDARFAEQVMARLEPEGVPAPVAPSAAETRETPRAWRSAAGMALAAMVAVATVLGVRALTSTQSSSPGQQVAGARVQAQDLSRGGTSAPDGAWAELPELADYLVHHAGFAPMRGTLPYARVVGYELPAR